MGALRAAFRVGEQLTTPLARDEAVTQPCAGEGAEVEEDGAFVGGRLALARELDLLLRSLRKVVIVFLDLGLGVDSSLVHHRRLLARELDEALGIGEQRAVVAVACKCV